MQSSAKRISGSPSEASCTCASWDMSLSLDLTLWLDLVLLEPCEISQVLNYISPLGWKQESKGDHFLVDIIHYISDLNFWSVSINYASVAFGHYDGHSYCVIIKRMNEMVHSSSTQPKGTFYHGPQCEQRQGDSSPRSGRLRLYHCCGSHGHCLGSQDGSRHHQGRSVLVQREQERYDASPVLARLVDLRDLEGADGSLRPRGQVSIRPQHSQPSSRQAARGLQLCADFGRAGNRYRRIRIASRRRLSSQLLLDPDYPSVTPSIVKMEGVSFVRIWTLDLTLNLG
jgi:hypothetical protein